MNKYAACVKAQKMLAQAREEMKRGGIPSIEEMHEIVILQKFCNIINMKDFWQEQWETYYGAVIPDGVPNTHELSHAQLQQWVQDMYSDGKTGARWTVEETTAVAKSHNVTMSGFDACDFWVAMNMMDSDYGAVFKKFGMQNNVDFYVCMTCAFLMDEDTQGAKENLYYKWLSRKTW